MCPDPSLISALSDNELPERFAQHIMEHIRECTACSEIYNALMQLDTTLHSFRDDQIMESKDRTIERIHRRILQRERPGFLDLRVRVPVPVILGFLAVVFFGGLPFAIVMSARTPVNVVSSELPVFSNMDELIVFLDTQKRVETIKMNLPEESFFVQVSKPVLVNEEDYKKILW